MRKIKLIVAYDGTNYSGWQIQPNGITVQEELEKALKDLLGEDIRIAGASRTDAGVHARGNVAVFETTARMPAERFAFALNTYLPEDIRIQGSEEVPLDFHPRFTETIKTYEYRILHRVFPDPTRRLDHLFLYDRLNVEAMREALTYVVGEHDFKSFQGAGGEASTHTTIRHIYQAELIQTPEDGSAGEKEAVNTDDDKAAARSDSAIVANGEQAYTLTIRVTGNGFLYNMVRILVGTLLEVGRGRIAPEEMKTILEARDREAAGPTAPAHGLTLVGIRYPELSKGME